MRVAYVIPSLQQPGGWRSHALAFINAMRKHVEPTLLVSQSDLPEARRLFPGDAIYSLPSTQQAALYSPRGWLPLWSTYRKITSLALPEVQLVHSLEAYPTGLVGSWLARRVRPAGRAAAPHILTVHGTYGVIWRRRRLDNAAYRGVLRGAAMVCPVSHGTARLMQRYYAAELKPEKLHPILNGNDFTRRVPAEVALQRTFPESPLLLSVGDVKPRKGLHLSLAAFQQVQAAMPGASYWIVGRTGDERYAQHLAQIVERLGLKNVRFLGAVSNEQLEQYYRQASIFVLAPEQQQDQFEGFGLVYLEAGAYGLPVVATRSGGVPDAVRDGETGLLADEGDASGVAQAILRLAQDPALLRQMGQANRRWAETLTWQRTADEQAQCYREVLEAR
jgi:glycosyltransferase involved in cell wall biosynthesis